MNHNNFFGKNLPIVRTSETLSFLHCEIKISKTDSHLSSETVYRVLKKVINQLLMESLREIKENSVGNIFQALLTTIHVRSIRFLGLS